MEQISKYFNAEKYESVLFVMVGIIAIIFAAYFLVKVKQPFYKGMAYPLIAVAIIQIVVGTSIYFRSPKDILRVNNIVEHEKSKIYAEEIPRMEVVMKNFVIYHWIEIILLLLGIIMFFYFEPNTLWKGVGLGLAIQASFMLLLDYFAESRGKTYLEFLQQLA
jgi:uncharacterized membrane protein